MSKLTFYVFTKRRSSSRVEGRAAGSAASVGRHARECKKASMSRAAATRLLSSCCDSAESKHIHACSCKIHLPVVEKAFGIRGSGLYAFPVVTRSKGCRCIGCTFYAETWQRARHQLRAARAERLVLFCLIRDFAAADANPAAISDNPEM